MRYEKGRKEATRQRIIDVAMARFRNDGIAGTGLASIMADAGLTNGAFYPHFASKTSLVREAVVEAIAQQADQLRRLVDAGGVDTVIESYLSQGHRDNPASGCPLAALLPELARLSPDAHATFAGPFEDAVHVMEQALPEGLENRESAAIGLLAILIGTLQLSRALAGTQLSDRILAGGADAARTMAPNAATG
jgi:TetR/AcrR family transcriptional repressor of nem operon